MWCLDPSTMESGMNIENSSGGRKRSLTMDEYCLCCMLPSKHTITSRVLVWTSIYGIVVEFQRVRLTSEHHLPMLSLQSMQDTSQRDIDLHEWHLASHKGWMGWMGWNSLRDPECLVKLQSLHMWRHLKYLFVRHLWQICIQILSWPDARVHQTT